MNIKQAFLTKVRKTDGCWLWRGIIKADGYGLVKFFGQTIGAHRVSYELFVGDIPDGLVIDHLCRTVNCVRPDHLEAVPQRTNIIRGVSPAAGNAVKTHCPKGHLLAESARIRSDGARVCRDCVKAQKREYAKRRRQATHSSP